MIELLINEQTWDLNKSFNISRGAKLKANTIHLQLIKNGEKGLVNVFPTLDTMRRLDQLKIKLMNSKLILNLKRLI